ncbi:50S ribosomal protein L11 [Candidatus Woesearchaeota archaeon]|nr:50S ribosomal protein L11 [Candidatus Woesearchaeota archaeon]
MASTTVEVLIEGGKATAAPPLGPALGPTGLNVGQVVVDINKKTAEFKGMQVPVKVIADLDTKEYKITVGTPPASALIKQESGIQKGSGKPMVDFVADLAIEQIIKIAKMKEDALTGKTMKERVKEIAGTCASMGVKIEGVPAIDAIKQINEGKYDQEITSEKTDLTAEEKKQLEDEKKTMQAELEAKRTQFEIQAKKIIEELKDKTSEEKRKALAEAKLPEEIINKLVPKDDKKKK